jgi:hypothetical protein
MQLRRHRRGRASPAIKNVRGTLPGPEQPPKIGLRVTRRFHPIADRVDRVGRLDRPVTLFVIGNHKSEQVELVGLR